MLRRAKEKQTNHFSRVSKHRVRIIPEAIEPQDVAIVVEELLQGVGAFVWSQRLHTFFHLIQVCVSVACNSRLQQTANTWGRSVQSRNHPISALNTFRGLTQSAITDCQKSARQSKIENKQLKKKEALAQTHDVPSRNVPCSNQGCGAGTQVILDDWSRSRSLKFRFRNFFVGQVS